MCNLHNEVFGRVETRINTKYFLPVREGVSHELQPMQGVMSFPPCTGGCIDIPAAIEDAKRISSLYGRVYRRNLSISSVGSNFLPVREGVSPILNVKGNVIPFPPCTGGCIMWRYPPRICQAVSSLYGRVYRDTKRPD